MLVDELKQQVLDGRWLDEQQAKSLLTADREALYAAAHEITRHYLGNKFDTCSIINARSGNCGENCKWCAQSAHYPTKVNLYPLLPAEECVRHAVYNERQGIGRFALVTSGKRVNAQDMQQIVETVKVQRIRLNRRWKRVIRPAKLAFAFVVAVLSGWERRWNSVLKWLFSSKRKRFFPFLLTYCNQFPVLRWNIRLLYRKKSS